MENKKKMSRRAIIRHWEQERAGKEALLRNENAYRWFRAVPYQLQYQKMIKVENREEV